MAFDDKFRVGAHAVVLNHEGKILQLKSTYGEKAWVLPGGGLEPGETIHQGLFRECEEELGVMVEIMYMSGMYFHTIYNAHACVFRCELPTNSQIKLSTEHSEYRYFNLDELNTIQRQRIEDCLKFDGKVKSAKF